MKPLPLAIQKLYGEGYGYFRATDEQIDRQETLCAPEFHSGGTCKSKSVFKITPVLLRSTRAAGEQRWPSG